MAQVTRAAFASSLATLIPDNTAGAISPADHRSVETDLADSAVWHDEVGTAAAADTGDFATAAQGALADTAVQPGDNISGLTNDAGYYAPGGVDVALADGGTGASSAATARANLGAAAKTVTINAQVGTAYTLALSDAGGIVSMSNASANTLTIPTNASVAFPVGTIINVTQLGAGATTIQGDTGVTVNGTSAGSEAISAQYKSAALVKHATDTWVVEGAVS